MIKNLLNLFFPNACYSCYNILTDNEKHFCTICRHSFPVTNYHFSNADHIKKVFYGRVKIEEATALFKFQKQGIVQQLIHNLKYKGKEQIGYTLGQWLGEELSTIPHYKTIDIVISVPLHKSKLKKRGYNQVTKFGIELAKALNANYVDNCLVKSTKTKTQVFKSRVSRWNSSNTIFEAHNLHLIEGKHILLVDDIITTGATMEACANVLRKAKHIKISLAAMAIA